MRCKTCFIFGIGQPCESVWSFRFLKSKQNRHFPFGFGVKCTWLQAVALLGWISFAFSAFSIKRFTSFCLDSTCHQSGALLVAEVYQLELAFVESLKGCTLAGFSSNSSLNTLVYLYIQLSRSSFISWSSTRWSISWTFCRFLSREAEDVSSILPLISFVACVKSLSYGVSGIKSSMLSVSCSTSIKSFLLYKNPITRTRFSSTIV